MAGRLEATGLDVDTSGADWYGRRIFPSRLGLRLLGSWQGRLGPRGTTLGIVVALHLIYPLW
jgi:hypothetical protein